MPADPLAAAKARIAEIGAELLRLVDEKVYWEAFVIEREKHLALLPGLESSKLSGRMQQEPAIKSKNTKISAALSVSPTVGVRALLIEANLTPASIAAELSEWKVKGVKQFPKRVARSTVQAWIDGRNAIPRAAQEYLWATHGIPQKSWPKRQD